MAAFAILILTSASATIGIANAVLGRRITELAKTKADYDLRTATLSWDQKNQAMESRLRAAAAFLTGDPAQARTALADIANDETGFDFLGVAGAGGELIARDPPGATGAAVPGSLRLGELLDGRDAGCAPVIMPLTEVPAVGARVAGHEKEGQVMVIVAAARWTHGNASGVLYGGAVVNGALPLVHRMIENVVVGASSNERLGAVATIFQGDARIVTSAEERRGAARGDVPVLSTADENVARRVLGEGKIYRGQARVVNERYYTAYRPIRDVAGRPIGMLGIGTAVREYEEAQSKTIALFSSLIAAGMIFGFAMTWLFSVWLTRPIKELVQGMSRVAEGDLNYKVPLHSADELGRLARAFNRMVHGVKERDLRLREMTESRLSEVEKQISIGRLAAGVAHEINNPLTAILSLSSLMLRHAPENDPRREDLEIVVSETTRCRKIVANLLEFARERPPEKKVIDLRDVVRDTLALAKKVRRAPERAARGRVLRTKPAGPGRRAPTPAGRHESHPQRGGGRRRAAGGGTARTRRGPRHDGRGLVRRLRARAREGRRPGHSAGPPRPHLRTLLHHQGTQQGHGSRSLREPRHRAETRRRDPGRKPRRRRHRGDRRAPAAPPGRDGTARILKRSRRWRRRQRAFWSSTTRSRCASVANACSKRTAITWITC
ncbi:MAG: cache domain-containing protein [Deltaproteobacteria bacterium]|nr:cache domain-containing protein [Deltaproteobacteria bacterium]